MAKNFPNLGEGSRHPGLGTEEVPNKINLQSYMPRHIIIKTTKVNVKEKMFKAPREKQFLMYRETPCTKLSPDLAAEILKTGREWYDIIKVWKETNKQANKNPSKQEFSIWQDCHSELKDR